MSISMFEISLPDEIILKICHYLSCFDVLIAFYNLNSRLNRTISEYLKHVSIGNDSCLKLFQNGCSFLLYHQSSLFFRIRTLTISNQGSPLAAKYFLSHIPIQDMIYLEKLTLIKFTGDELLSYLDVIGKDGQHTFQHLVTLHIYDPPYLNHRAFHMYKTWKEEQEYESNIINRVLMANNQRLQSIMVDGDDVFMETNLNVIKDPCIKLHTLSITLTHHDELILLFSIIPNIRCLHVTLHSVPTFESSLWSSIVLPYLVEFRLWAESSIDWSVETLMILLRLMPALRRLLLNLVTTDARLLDGQQVRAAIATVKILPLDDFNYGVDYAGSQLEHSLISNIPQTWLPQPIALTFNAETNELLLHTVPCVFHRFWMRKLPYKIKTSILKQEAVSCYGDGAYITHCHAYTPWDLSELYTFMQRSSHVEHLTFWLPDNNLRKMFGMEKELIVSMSAQQQFHLTSLRILGNYCENVQLIQLLVTFGSYLRKLHIDFDCLLNLINDVSNNAQLKASILQRNLVYLDIDTIYDSEVNSGAFRRVISFLFDNSNSIRHITLVLFWDFEIFGSSDDMTVLMEILCSFKCCTSLTSIVIYHCLFSNQFNDNSQTMSIQDHFHEWLNENTHLTFEQQFDIECDINNKTLKLWLK